MYLGTVLLQWLQWYMCSDHSWRFTTVSYQIPDPRVITHTNQSQLLNNGSYPPPTATPPTTCREAAVASVWHLSRTPFHNKEPTCQDATVAFVWYSPQTPSKGTNNLSRSDSTVATIWHLSQTLSQEKAFPACTCTELQYSYMMKRPSQLPVLLLQPFWWWSTWPPQQARRDRTCIQNINVLSICSTSANVIFIFNMYKWEISRVHGHTIRIAYFS